MCLWISGWLEVFCVNSWSNFWKLLDSLLKKYYRSSMSTPDFRFDSVCSTAVCQGSELRIVRLKKKKKQDSGEEVIAADSIPAWHLYSDAVIQITWWTQLQLESPKMIFWNWFKLQGNDSLKVSCFYNWTYSEIKQDVLAAHSLHTVPAQKESLTGDTFCYKSNCVYGINFLIQSELSRVGARLC